MLKFLFNIKNKDACDFHTGILGILVYIFIMKVFSIQKLR